MHPLHPCFDVCIYGMRSRYYYMSFVFPVKSFVVADWDGPKQFKVTYTVALAVCPILDEMKQNDLLS
jgi:hypothetical protein